VIRVADFVEIPIIESARRVGLRLRDRTIRNVEVEAHCPFCGDSKYHLFLNTRKNIFYCQRCKVRGNSITLYAKMMKVDNKEAYRELTKGNLYAFPLTPQPKENDEQEPKPLHIRHDVYYDLLNMLELSEKHRENLLSRGLSGERIERNMYRSFPADRAVADEVLQILSSQYDLTGIPGFYTKSGSWRMSGNHGFLIPVCSPEGYIQGLQIRLDNEEHRKYRWFSSRYEQNGTRAYPWIHVTGNRESKTAVITEGALKADVASSLSKDTLFAAVPGINCLSRLPDVLKSLNVSKVTEAFDMDKLNNPRVAEAVREVEAIASNLRLEYQPFNWNSSYKGIDDYLLSRVAV
jgi:hypothetical protein